MPGFAPFPPPAGSAPWRWRLHFVASALVVSVLLPMTFFFAYILVSEQYLPYAESKKSQNWQAAQGYIVESFIDERGNRFTPLVVYSYKVGDVEYRNSRILFVAQKPKFEIREEALKLLAPFGEFRDETNLSGREKIEVIKSQAGRNRQAEIFYDPANPQNSTLRKEYLTADIRLFVCGIPIFLFICAISATSILSWSRSIRKREYEAVKRHEN